jgi:carboxylate-amine ligase
VLVDEDDTVTPKPRYLRIHEQYAEVARSALACAMHVHVEVADDEEGVRVLDGIAPWLPVLLAVSADSPYFHGRDTGYASWRSQVWSRWPSHGTGQPFGSVQTYREVVAGMVETGSALDEQMAYFDARLSPAYPTVEVRVADVCTDVDDAVLVAALARGLVATAALAEEPPSWRSELVTAATWRASRHGLAERLVHPGRRELAPARDVLEALVTHVRPALEEAGDLGLVEDSVARLLATGTGATRQRRTFESSGRLEDVVADAVERTSASWAG